MHHSNIVHMNIFKDSIFRVDDAFKLSHLGYSFDMNSTTTSNLINLNKTLFINLLPEY